MSKCLVMYRFFLQYVDKQTWHLKEVFYKVSLVEKKICAQNICLENYKVVEEDERDSMKF